MKLSEVLREKLKDRNLAQIARRLKIPRTLLHDWIHGRRAPSLKNVAHLKRLAEYLSISLEELLLNSNSSKTIDSVLFEDAGRRYRIRIERVDSGEK